MDGPPFIKSYVIGYKISDKITPHIKIGQDPVRGRLDAVSYSQLVRTAERRLFNLRDRLKNRYDEIRGESLLEKVLGPTIQESLDLSTNGNHPELIASE